MALPLPRVAAPGLSHLTRHAAVRFGKLKRTEESRGDAVLSATAFGRTSRSVASTTLLAATAHLPMEQDTGKSLILYANPVSTCSRRVILTLLEKGLPDFKLELVNLMTKEQKSPAFMAMQPFGQIPVLKDDDLTLFESRAIAWYIAEKYDGQGTPLLGSTPQERALVGVWVEVESQEYNPPVSVIAKEMVIGPRYGRTPDKQKAEEAAESLGKVLDVLEERLEEQDYLAGNFVSLADLSMVPYTALLWPAGYARVVEERPNVLAWWNRLTQRDSWKRIVAGMP